MGTKGLGVKGYLLGVSDICLGIAFISIRLLTFSHHKARACQTVLPPYCSVYQFVPCVQAIPAEVFTTLSPSSARDHIGVDVVVPFDQLGILFHIHGVSHTVTLPRTSTPYFQLPRTHMLSPCENHESVQLGRSAIHRPGFEVKLYCALDPIGCSIFAQLLPYDTGSFSILITGTSYSSSESLKYHETNHSRIRP